MKESIKNEAKELENIHALGDHLWLAELLSFQFSYKRKGHEIRHRVEIFVFYFYSVLLWRLLTRFTVGFSGDVSHWESRKWDRQLFSIRYGDLQVGLCTYKQKIFRYDMICLVMHVRSVRDHSTFHSGQILHLRRQDQHLHQLQCRFLYCQLHIQRHTDSRFKDTTILKWTCYEWFLWKHAIMQIFSFPLYW